MSKTDSLRAAINAIDDVGQGWAELWTEEEQEQLESVYELLREKQREIRQERGKPLLAGEVQQIPFSQVQPTIQRILDRLNSSTA